MSHYGLVTPPASIRPPAGLAGHRPLNGEGMLSSGPAVGANVYVVPEWAAMRDPRRVQWIRQNMIEEAAHDPRIAWLAARICRDAGAPTRDGPRQAAALLAFVQKHTYYANEKGERLQAPWVTLEAGTGDCLPATTRLVRRIDDKRAEQVAIADVQVGDYIWGRSRWSQVQAVVDKGELPVDRVVLGSGRQFEATPGHQVYLEPDLVRGTVAEIVARRDHPERLRVSALDVGMRLLTPLHRPLVGFTSADEIMWAGPTLTPTNATVITSAERSVRTTRCYDIQTDDHYVYLPEADVTVSNCDDLVILLCSLAESMGLGTRMVLYGRDGRGRIYRWCEGRSPAPPSGVVFEHIYCEIGWPALSPRNWASCEPTIKGAPLGYDVAFHGVQLDRDGRVVGLGRWGQQAGQGGSSMGQGQTGLSGVGAWGGLGGARSGGYGTAAPGNSASSTTLAANGVETQPSFFQTLFSPEYLRQLSLSVVEGVAVAVATWAILKQVNRKG